MIDWLRIFGGKARDERAATERKLEESQRALQEARQKANNLNELPTPVVAIAANVAAETNMALVRRLRIRACPTTVIISPTVGVVDVITGYMGPNELRTRLKRVAEKKGI